MALARWTGSIAVVAAVEIARHPFFRVGGERTGGEGGGGKLAHHVERAVRDADRLGELAQKVHEVGEGGDLEELVGDRFGRRISEDLDLVEVERVQQSVQVGGEMVLADPCETVDRLAERGLDPANHTSPRYSVVTNKLPAESQQLVKGDLTFPGQATVNIDEMVNLRGAEGLRSRSGGCRPAPGRGDSRGDEGCGVHLLGESGVGEGGG